PIGPHAAVADVKSDRAIVYAQGQSINGIPTSISTILAGLPKPVNLTPAQIRVIWYEGSGSYGGGQQGEAAEQAAIISAAVGAPVRLQWMRWDQHGWDSYGPSQMHDVTMGADATGRIVAADWTTYAQAGQQMDTTRELL